MTDKNFEEMLKKAVSQCVEKECKEVSRESKKVRYKTSKDFDEKMVKLYKREKHHNDFMKENEKNDDKIGDTDRRKKNKVDKRGVSGHKRKVKRKMVLVAALVAVLLCGSVFAQEAIQEWRSNLVVNHKKDYVQIEYGGKEKEDTREKEGLKEEKAVEDKQKENKEKQEKSEEIIDYSVPGKYKVRWVPKGYKKENEKTDDKNPYWYTMTYSNKNGDLIVYDQHDADYVINIAFDEEKDTEEDISVCGVKGKYFTQKDRDGDRGIIIYEVNGVTYTIQGGVSKETLVKILESRVRVQE